MDLDENYTTSVVGSSGRSYLWVLSRTPQINDATYNRLVEVARAQGFEMKKLVRTKQSDAQK